MLIDIAPEEVKLQHQMDQRGMELIRTGGLLTGLLATLTLYFVGDFYKYGSYQDELQRQIEKTAQAAQKVEQKAEQLKILQMQRDPNTSLLYYLQEIANTTPSSIFFTLIQYDEGKGMELRGLAEEMSEVFNFVQSLENLKRFRGIKSEDVSKKKVDGRNLAEFKIFCRL